MDQIKTHIIMLSEVPGQPLDSTQRDLIAELNNASDRAVALLAAARLDAQLQELLTAAIPNREFRNSTKRLESLFGPYRPLYELGPKINMSLALDLITAEAHASLTMIQKVRNEFAHSQLPIQFNSEQISKFIIPFREAANIPPMIQPGAKGLERTIFMTLFLGLMPMRAGKAREGKAADDPLQES